MRKKRRLWFVFLPALLVFWAGNLPADAPPLPVFSVLKVGDEAHWFTLPSSEDRLVDYHKDFYGKHHLVMTFFPAAFTPT